MPWNKRLLIAGAVLLSLLLLGSGLFLIFAGKEGGGLLIAVTSLVLLYVVDALSIRFKVGFHRWRGREKYIALTFDDGPGELTVDLLAWLRARGIRATFFFLGDRVLKHPGVAQQALADGHRIGGHGFSHRRWFRSKVVLRHEIAPMLSAFRQANIPPPLFLRAPHGTAGFPVRWRLRRAGYDLIGWTRGLWDTVNPPADFMFRLATHKPGTGEILLLHDGRVGRPPADRAAFFQALDQIVHFYRDRGYEFVTLDQWWSRPSRPAEIEPGA